MQSSAVDIRQRALENFAQLILLLVNIIQGISLGVLATRIVVIDLKNPDYAFFARLIACLVMIWFVTFQYAVAVVTLWFVTNGIRDILFILIFGVAEYGAMYAVGDPQAWLWWVVAMIGAGVLCFLSTNAHAKRMVKEVSNPIMNDVKKHTVENLTHVIISGSLLFCLSLVSWMWPSFAIFLKNYYSDFFVPMFIVGYCLYVLWHDNQFLNIVFSNREDASQSVKPQEQ